MDQVSITQVITQISSIGFAVWYAWHTTTITIPRLVQANEENTKALTARYDAMLRELIADFRSDIRDERVTSERLREAISDLRQTISDVHNDKSATNHSGI